MYVSGETGEPSVETTSIIEDIVRQQVIELVSHLDTYTIIIRAPIGFLYANVYLASAAKLHGARLPTWLQIH